MERRRHIRQKVSSITYLEFGDDNGGILLNLGGGGLSLQAVAKLNPGQELTLRFGLFNDEELITVAGRVIWVSATRKDAGICFAGLSERSSDAIEKWLAAQDAERISAEWKAVAASESEPGKRDSPSAAAFHRHLTDPKNGPEELVEAPIPLIAATSELHLSDSFLDHAMNRAKTSPVFGTYVPTMMPTRLVSPPKEHPKPGLPPTNSPDSPQDAKQLTVRLFRPIPPESSKNLSNEIQVVLPTVHQELVAREPFVPPGSYSPAPAASISRTNSVLPTILGLSGEQAHRRTMQISAGVAACIGILLLLFMTANMGRHTSGDISTAPTHTQSIATSSPVSVTGNPAATPGSSSTVAAGPGSKTGRAQNTPELQKNSSTVAAAGTAVNSEQLSAPAQITPRIVQQGSDSSWLEALKPNFFWCSGRAETRSSCDSRPGMGRPADGILLLR